MKWVMVSFFDYLIPYKEVVKVGSMEEQKNVIGKLHTSFLLWIYRSI